MNYLIKHVVGASVVEKVNGINMIALDKTGTVTKGQFRVIDQYYYEEELVVHPQVQPKFDPALELEEILESYSVLECAVALEEKSTHPLASCIVECKYIIVITLF